MSYHYAPSSPPTQLIFFCLLFLVRSFQLIILFPSSCATASDRRSAGTDKNKKHKVSYFLLFVFVSKSLLPKTGEQSLLNLVLFLFVHLILLLPVTVKRLTRPQTAWAVYSRARVSCCGFDQADGRQPGYPGVHSR